MLATLRNRGLREGDGTLPRGRFRPLAEAASGPRDAREAWHEYRSALGGETPNPGEFVLYPMVADRLDREALAGGDMRVLRLARAAAHEKNEMILLAARALADEAEKRGIPLLFTKGIAMVLRAYRRRGLRTSQDVDCFLPPEYFPQLMRMIGDFGWKAKGNKDFLWHNVNNGRALTFSTPYGCDLDFHFHPRRSFVFHAEFLANYQATFRTVEWEGRTWRIPSDTWLLIETIEHGVRYNQVASIRWVPDALILLRCPDLDVDWDYLLRAVRMAGLVHTFRTGFSALADLGAPIPGQVMAELEAEPARMSERLEFWLMQGDRTPVPIGLSLGFLQYYRRAPGSLRARMRGFPAYLRSSVPRYSMVTGPLRRALSSVGISRQ